MKGLVKVGIVLLVAVAVAILPCACKPAAPKTLAEYNVANYSDLTGVYAELSKMTIPAQKVAFDYWNENVGKKLGVKLVHKIYDSRYDAAEVSSIHARIVPMDKPIAILTQGGPSVLPIVEKLPEQKIVAIHGTAGYGFLHRQAGWVFCPLRGYTHHIAAAADWFAKEWKEPRKLRFCVTIFEGVTAKDISEPADPYVKSNPKIEMPFGGTINHDGKAVDLTGFVRKVMEEGKPDVIFLAPTGISATAFYSAMKELGYLHKVPIINPCYQGLGVMEKMVGAAMIEGDYEANTVNMMPETEGYKIFSENIAKYAPGSPWGGSPAQYTLQVYLLGRAVERAVEKVGAANVTGQALYDVLNQGDFQAKEFYGLGGDAKFTPDDRLAGFSAVYMYRMKNGKVELAGKQPISAAVKMPYMK